MWSFHNNTYKNPQMALSWSRRIKSIPLRKILSISISMHVSHPGLCPRTGHLHSGVPTQLLLLISKYLKIAPHALPICLIKPVTCDLGNIERFLKNVLIEPMFHILRYLQKLCCPHTSDDVRSWSEKIWNDGFVSWHLLPLVRQSCTFSPLSWIRISQIMSRAYLPYCRNLHFSCFSRPRRKTV
jgi:hypothetical protein